MIDKKASLFNVNGSFEIYLKKSEKSQTNYIYTLQDTQISNDIFGKFILNQGQFYEFNIKTLGRDPILKRNNLWISKKRIYELIKNGSIKDPKEVLIEIAKKI